MFSRSSYRKEIQKLIEDPLPKHSSESYFIQLADTVSFIIHLYVKARLCSIPIPWGKRIQQVLFPGDEILLLDILRGKFNLHASRSNEYGIVYYPKWKKSLNYSQNHVNRLIILEIYAWERCLFKHKPTVLYLFHHSLHIQLLIWREAPDIESLAGIDRKPDVVFRISDLAAEEDGLGTGTDLQVKNRFTLDRVKRSPQAAKDKGRQLFKELWLWFDNDLNRPVSIQEHSESFAGFF